MPNNSIHILLAKAKKYVKKKQPEQIYKNYNYNPLNGYWAQLKDGIALMRSALAVKPTTKKEDIETGEDRKGE